MEALLQVTEHALNEYGLDAQLMLYESSKHGLDLPSGHALAQQLSKGSIIGQKQALEQEAAELSRRKVEQQLAEIRASEKRARVAPLEPRFPNAGGVPHPPLLHDIDVPRIRDFCRLPVLPVGLPAPQPGPSAEGLQLDDLKLRVKAAAAAAPPLRRPTYAIKKSPGGKGLCEHGRQRCRCKICGGGSICAHGRRRTACKECGGKEFCVHGRRKSICKDCGGASLCEHGRRRIVCKKCEGSGICPHGRVRRTCKECSRAFCYSVDPDEIADRDAAQDAADEEEWD